MFYLGLGATVETHVIESCVVPPTLAIFHLGLNAADASIATFLAPGSILSPPMAVTLQNFVAAAAEFDVIGGSVVTNALTVLHTQLEGDECSAGAIPRARPVTPAEGEGMGGKGEGMGGKGK